MLNDKLTNAHKNKFNTLITMITARAIDITSPTENIIRSPSNAVVNTMECRCAKYWYRIESFVVGKSKPDKRVTF